MIGSLKSAWRLEKRRYARRKQHPFRIGNDVLNAWLMSAVLWGGLIAWLGVGILPYLLIQAVVGFSLLEVVNYMEHYGMLRQKVASASGSATSGRPVALVELQQHRHQRAALPPAAAQRPPRQPHPALPDAARLRGEPGSPDRVRRMIVLAIVPAVWRRVMDPRVLAHFDGDLTRANLSPRKRDRILAKYPPLPTASPPPPT